MRAVLKALQRAYSQLRLSRLRLANNLRCKLLRLRGYTLGRQVYLGPGVRLGPQVQIGDQTSLMGDCHLQGEIMIGSNVIISTGCSFLAVNHDYDFGDALPYGSAYIRKKIVIGDNVWIGANVQIVPGVAIGEGAVIGMGSVVTHDVPPLAVAAGNPARVIRSRHAGHYQRLLDEQKFLNLIRADLPGKMMAVRRNRAAFERKIEARGFVLNHEIEITDAHLRSAVLYELSLGMPGLRFGNAGVYHIAIQEALLRDLPSACAAVASTISRIAPTEPADEAILQADLERLAASLET